MTPSAVVLLFPCLRSRGNRLLGSHNGRLTRGGLRGREGGELGAHHLAAKGLDQRRHVDMLAAMLAVLVALSAPLAVHGVLELVRARRHVAAMRCDVTSPRGAG